MNRTIRIIGGKYRGRKLSFPEISDLRPTPDRVRETLFNWLMHDINTATCLDLFAGSGALGFEALSRGASKAVMIEKNRHAWENLTQNAAILKLDKTQCQILNIAAQNYLATSTESFDIIFMDPPFKDNYDEYLQSVASTNILRSGGLLYIESPKLLTMEADTFQQLRHACHGHVSFALYRKS